jgi:hypothetical protein
MIPKTVAMEMARGGDGDGDGRGDVLYHQPIGG